MKSFAISLALISVLPWASAQAGGFGSFLKRAGRANTSRKTVSSSAPRSSSNRSTRPQGDRAHRPVQIDSLPSDLDSFLALRDVLATSPEGGAVMFILAAHLYTQNEALGVKAFAITLDQKLVERTGGGYKGYEPTKGFLTWVKRLKRQKYAPRSYIQGTSPVGGYELPSPPYHFNAFENPHSRMPNGAIKIFLETSGADFPRPYLMKANSRGIWKVAGSEGNIYLGMKEPVAVDAQGQAYDGDDL